MMVTRWLFPVALFCGLSACAAPPAADRVVKVGMPYARAEALLIEAGAEPQVFAVAPPQRDDGSYLQIDCFELASGASLVVTYDDRSEFRIVELSICEDPLVPRSEALWQKRKSLKL